MFKTFLYDKLKKSKAAKNSEKVFLCSQNRIKLKQINKVCKCGNNFFSKKKSQQYCSKICGSKFCDKTNFGGYREGSGRSKSGYYKGIYCGSTYELIWMIYHIDNNIPFKRFPGLLTDGKIKYFPDFLLEDNKTIIELKGFENKEKTQLKTNLAESKGFIVKVLYKEDIELYRLFVENKYKTKKIEILYDDYKPSFEYNCSFCKKVFFKDKKLKTSKVYCSNICSGKGNKNV